LTSIPSLSSDAGIGFSAVGLGVDLGAGVGLGVCVGLLTVAAEEATRTGWGSWIVVEISTAIISSMLGSKITSSILKTGVGRQKRLRSERRQEKSFLLFCAARRFEAKDRY
jgi:hypothetical protein